MARDGERREDEREPVHGEENEVQCRDGVDQVRQDAFRGDRMFFHELGEVVEARGDGESEEDEAEEESDISLDCWWLVRSVVTLTRGQLRRHTSRGRIHMLVIVIGDPHVIISS